MLSLGRIKQWLPRGDRLSQSRWDARHRALLTLAALHVLGFGLYSVASGYAVGHVLAETLPVAVPTLLATRTLLSRRVRELCVVLAMLNASAILVHLMDGAVEAHFHFFLVVSVLAFYEQWAPYLAAVAYVLLHHVAAAAVIGGGPTISHGGTVEQPLLWSAVHAGFIGAQGILVLLAWKFNEDARAEAQAAHARFRWQAQHDPLTGLPNRLHVIDRLEAALRGRDQLAVAAFGVDDFKLINDSLGRHAGDELLRGIATRLRSTAGPDATVARIGGDEFLLLLPGVATEAEGLEQAARLAGALREPWHIGGGTHYVSASAGLRVITSVDVDATGVLGDADAALYRAKQVGKGGCEVFDDSMRERAKLRLELDGSLRHAAARGELRLLYQPQIALAGGTVSGVEALVRWEHPTLGLVSPADFIPLAERNGTIVEIGAWVLDEACRQAAVWARPELKVSVNVSARQLATDGFVDDVADCLRRHDIAPGQLCLEVTETAVLGEPAQTRRVLDRLGALGVRLAVDDFGVGFASLAHLRQLLPVDTLKIDKSFVDGVLKDPEDGAIVAGVIRLAHSLGLSVVAEGIEEAGQAELLRSWDCETGQGYHFARPLDPAAIAEMLGQEPSPRLLV